MTELIFWSREDTHENIQFLLVLTCILKAVDKHADLFVSPQQMLEMTSALAAELRQLLFRFPWRAA